MNKIQKLVIELEAEKENAQKMVDTPWNRTMIDTAEYKGELRAFSLCIQKLKLLLKTENENGGKKDG